MTTFNSNLLEQNYRGSCSYKGVGFADNVYRAALDGPYIAFVGYNDDVKHFAPNKNMIAWLSHWEDPQEAAWCVYMFNQDYDRNMEEFSKVGQGNWRPAQPVPTFTKDPSDPIIRAKDTQYATKRKAAVRPKKLLTIGQVFELILNKYSLGFKDIMAKLTKADKNQIQALFNSTKDQEEAQDQIEEFFVTKNLI